MVDYNPIYTTSESNQSVEYLKEKIQNLEFEIQQLENRKHDEQKEYMKNIEIEKIINHLKNNIVGTLIITDNTELYKVESKCNRCNHIQEKIVEQQKVIPTKTEFKNSPCPSCKAENIETDEQDIVDYLALLAAKTGSKIEVISGNTEHGLMLGSIGKVGAILRYNPNYSS